MASDDSIPSVSVKIQDEHDYTYHDSDREFGRGKPTYIDSKLSARTKAVFRETQEWGHSDPISVKMYKVGTVLNKNRAFHDDYSAFEMLCTFIIVKS